jgi:hypothetical protein
MSETQTPAADSKAAKKEVVYTKVAMSDGKEVSFPGDRKAQKEVFFDADAGTFGVRINFVNGKFVAVNSTDLARDISLQLAAHGLSQKVGDTYASLKDVDDMALAADEMRTQLVGGDWGRQREAGDSMSGASVVIRALVEVTGKTVEDIKAFLQGKLDAAKAANQKLSRQDLYASFRKPGTKTAEVIERMEREKAAKASGADANAMLAELGIPAA